tara:strand:+ start:652 stop:1230 length:579 start_codon:yes stop_codon:yes gene_type:complete
MRLAVLCSGNGSNFENIVRVCDQDQVVLMIHNKRECGAAKRADKLGIPHCCIKIKDEDQIIQLLQAWRVDIVVLAGWMRVISSDFIKAFPKTIINIHPSLLPKHKGLHAVQQAIDSKESHTGCSVHYVTEELDSGEVICQSREIPIRSDDTTETLARRIQKEEHRILPMAIEHVKHEVQTRTYRYLLSDEDH